MKYIVDLPKEYISGSSLFGKILSIPIQINGDKNYNIPTSIKITPYTELDRTQIEDEAWSLAETLIDEMTSDEVLEVTGNRCLFELSYQEAKERYEAWLKQKDNVIKQKVFDLAEEIGIHKLYAIVREIRGE